MITTKLTDLDELILTVRDKTSLSYISEAVDAYRVGAYRSAIVSTWIAVSYDIIAKIRELDSQGDTEAKAFISNMDKFITNKDIRKLQGIELELLKYSYEKFEFLSSHEYQDLSRLREDRHLCAHPAFVKEDFLFEPTPELVRTHIVHAIKHLLQHPPVQGKSAIERIMNDIKRPSFPRELEDIGIFLKTKYLDRAKDALVRNLIVVLVKTFLKNEPDFPKKKQELWYCLKSISDIYPGIYEQVMSEKLSNIVRSLDDNELLRVFLLLGKDQRCWDWLTDAEKAQIKGLITTSKELIGTKERYEALEIVFLAMKIRELKTPLLELFNNFDLKRQIKVISKYPCPEFADKSIEIYSKASSFREAEWRGESVIVPMADCFSPDHILEVLSTAKINNQIWDASGTANIMAKFFDNTKRHLDNTKDGWKKFIDWVYEKGCHNQYSKLGKQLENVGVTLPLPPVEESN